MEFINKKHLSEIDDLNIMYNTTYEEFVINHNILKEKLLEKQFEDRNNLILNLKKTKNNLI